MDRQKDSERAGERQLSLSHALLYLTSIVIKINHPRNNEKLLLFLSCWWYTALKQSQDVSCRGMCGFQFHNLTSCIKLFRQRGAPLRVVENTQVGSTSTVHLRTEGLPVEDRNPRDQVQEHGKEEDKMSGSREHSSCGVIDYHWYSKSYLRIEKTTINGPLLLCLHTRPYSVDMFYLYSLWRQMTYYCPQTKQKVILQKSVRKNKDKLPATEWLIMEQILFILVNEWISIDFNIYIAI